MKQWTSIYKELQNEHKKKIEPTKSKPQNSPQTKKRKKTTKKTKTKQKKKKNKKKEKKYTIKLVFLRKPKKRSNTEGR